jgi:UDP-N-acetylmuramoyl-tripeptide--D-alanyl-D-alanine ligase
LPKSRYKNGLREPPYEAASVVKGRLIGPDVRFAAVSTDSRKIAVDDLFIALQGLNFDGSEYAAGALQAGAAAALVDQKTAERWTDQSASILLVEDTRLALGQLAAYWRKQFDIPLVGITGSNGKTTVKEMLSGILREASNNDAVLATRGNLNNDIGMPLTLLQLNAKHRYAVIEMGMNHPGEIDYLTRIACPDVTLITNASGAHLQGLGTVEAVALAKGEIFAGLKPQGSAIFNADDQYAPLWRKLAGAHPILEFGLEQKAAVTGVWQAQTNMLNLQTPAGNFSVKLQVPGAHNARNALAAAAAAIALKVPKDCIIAGLAAFSGVNGRLQFKAARHGARIIDDTYNANPASMRAAISVLAQMPGQRVLVLGDMGELGDDAAQMHAELGREARLANIDKVYALGPLCSNAVREFGAGAQHFACLEDLQPALEQELNVHTTLLIKGSRFMKMERVVKFLEEKTCS